MGMSGGNRIFIESIKRWQKSVDNIEIMTCQSGKVMIDKNITDFTNIHVNVLKVPRILYKNLFLLYLYKTIMGSIATSKAVASSNNPAMIFSTSDIFPDSIPGFFARLRHRSARWIAAFYFFAAPPFSKDFPYKGFKAIARGIIYYFTQRVCYFFSRKFSDYVVACNEIERTQFIKDGYPEKKICTIYGGVDLSIADSTPEPEEKKFDAVFLARFHPQKGPMEAAKVWNEVVRVKEDAQLAMIGDGPEEKSVRAYIKKHGLDNNVTLLGFMDGKEKFKVLKSSRIFLHPAIYETGGMAAAEGMAGGLPVLAFDHPGYDHCYPKGIIRISPIGDCRQMAERAIELLEGSPEYGKIKTEACEFVKTFSWDYKAKFLLDKIISVQNHSPE